jgi:hypothetical protein
MLSPADRLVVNDKLAAFNAAGDNAAAFDAAVFNVLLVKPAWLA